MNIFETIDKKAYDIISSGTAQLIYFVIIIVCLIMIVRKEGFWAYDSGASMRHFSNQTSTNQGDKDPIRIPETEMYYNKY